MLLPPLVGALSTRKLALGSISGGEDRRLAHSRDRSRGIRIPKKSLNRLLLFSQLLTRFKQIAYTILTTILHHTYHVDYVTKITNAANLLVKQRLLLQQNADLIIKQAVAAAIP
jgi:hypothetical protein